MPAIPKFAWYEPPYDLRKAHEWLLAREARDPGLKAANDEARAKVADLKQNKTK